MNTALLQLLSILPENGYLRAAVVFIFYFVIAELVALGIEKILMKLAKKTKTNVDDLIIQKTKKPIVLIILLIGVRIAGRQIPITGGMLGILDNTIASVTVLISMWIIISVIDIFIDNWGRNWAKQTKSHVDNNLITLLHKVSKLVVIIVGLLYLLDVWGVSITPLLASLGVVGIAVAFALQTTLGNVFGGMSLIIDRSLRVGDVIQLDPETIGAVVDVGVRSTKIKTFDNELIILPNGKLADMRIKNFAKPDLSARLVISFSVAYGSKIAKVKKVVLDEIKKVKELRSDPEPYIRFLEMGESSLNFKAYMWLDDYKERFMVKDKVNTRIYNTLNKEGISIPFPQMDVHVKK